MAELPPKPLQSAYEGTSHRRNPSSQSGSTWNGSQSYNGPGQDDRRSRYARSSYQGSGGRGSSSSHNSTSSSFHTSFSQPSPSSSTTSTASSLRTPPDLLLNGGSLASLKGMTSLDEKGKASSHADRPVHLSVHQLERRLDLLSQLSKVTISSALPTPPNSPKMAIKSTLESRKRKADYSSASDKSEEESRKKRLNDAGADQSSRGSVSAAHTRSPSEHWDIPSRREWAKEVYFETAVAYRHRGRELKHRGDHRRRDISTNKALASSPEKESLVASLEQMDALLLYAYGFWCEDQANGASCIVANWTSLYGLLRYVYDQLVKNKMTVLAGLCRLLEAVVRRHVASHEMRLVSHRLSRTVASTSTTAQSPASNAEPSPSSSDNTQQALVDASEAMTRIIADNERSQRLIQQSRQTILNISVLQETYPQVASLCDGFMKNRQWNSLDPVTLSFQLDPSGGLEGANIEGDKLASSINGWVWPIDLSTPFPPLVCFARAVLREAAQEAKVHFIMEPVRLS